MDMKAVREYEKKSQEETNQKVLSEVEPTTENGDDAMEKCTKDVSELD